MEYGEHLIDFIEESPTDVNFKSILRNHIQESTRKGAYGGKYNLIINEGIAKNMSCHRILPHANTLLL